MSEERGKRKMARRVAVCWGLFSTTCLAAIFFGGMEPHEVEAVIALHWAVTIVSGPLIASLFGLDAAGAQIIPAMKDKA